MSLEDLKEMMEGHQLDVRENYEASRLGAYLSILPHIGKADQMRLTPQKLFPFYWEQDVNNHVPSTKEDLEHGQKLFELVESGKLKKLE